MKVSEQEEVKEWVLAISVGRQNIEKQLKLDSERESYEASSIDSLGNDYPICVISGFLRVNFLSLNFFKRLSGIRRRSSIRWWKSGNTPSVGYIHCFS